MNFFNLILSGKHFIFPSALNDSFAGYSNLGCRPLPFMTWTTSCQSLLACKVSFEKSADGLMGIPLQVAVSFSLAALRFSLYLYLWLLIIMCLRVGLFASILFGTLCASWTCMSTSPNQGSFFHYFSKQISNFLLFLFFWHPYDANVGMLEVVPEAAYTILIFLESFSFLLF